jgi:spore coat protein U-like protein
MSMKRLMAFFVFLALIAAAAFANTTSATMIARATLRATATVSATNLDSNSQAVIEVTATTGTPYSLSLDAIHGQGSLRAGTDAPQSYIAFGELLPASATPNAPVGQHQDFVTVTINY